jgi:hypothetical protein
MRLCTVSSTPATDSGVGLILPCAYSDISGGYALTGEQRLMLALLVDAINVYQKGAMSQDARARRLYVDAEHWIMATTSGGDVLSFDNVCDALGINAKLLRRRIVGWKHALNHQRRDRVASPLSLRITPRERPTNHRRGRPPVHSDALGTAASLG